MKLPRSVELKKANLRLFLRAEPVVGEEEKIDPSDDGAKENRRLSLLLIAPLCLPRRWRGFDLGKPI